MNTFIQTRITAGILTVIPMRMPTGITDCMIRLVSTQQAPLAVILTRISVRMPAEILVSGAAALDIDKTRSKITGAISLKFSRVCLLHTGLVILT